MQSKNSPPDRTLFPSITPTEIYHYPNTTELAGQPLPPLPTLTDPKLKRLFFIGRCGCGSIDQCENEVTREGFDVNKYERLAWDGEGLLDSIVRCLLHDLYPDLNREAAKNLLDRLLDEASLSGLSKAYKLPSHHSHFHSLSQSQSPATTFQAYIAAIYQSNIIHYDEHRVNRTDAMRTLEDWLRDVLKPLAEEYHRDMWNDEAENSVGEEEEDSAADGAKALLHELFQKLGYPTLKYEYKPVFPPGIKGEQGRLWKCILVARDRNGMTWTGIAVRKSIKAAATVASWKVYREVFPILVQRRGDRR